MTADLRSVPVAPGRIPLLGHVLPLWRRPFSFLTSLRDVGELVRVDVGTLPIYIATTAELTNEILITKVHSFDKGRIFERARSLVGEGLLTAGAEVHRRHRRIMQPMFHHTRIAQYAEVMSKQARAIAESWKPGQRIAVHKAMFEFTVSTLTETMFSTKLGHSTARQVIEDVPTIVKYILLRGITPKALERLPIPTNRNFDAAAARLLKTVNEAIMATRQSGDMSETDLLTTLLTARDADTGEGLTDSEVRDEIVTLMIAGTETAANTLAWTFYELARHPEVHKRLVEEVDSVVGTRPVTIDDIPKLEYTRQVFDEVVRLHAVTLLMRRTTEPVEFGGFHLPKGTEVAFSPYALHRDPRFFPDPERFDPDRWLPERRKTVPKHAYIPFSAGIRKCIGDSFGWTESIIAIATIVSRWELRPVPGVPVREVVAAVPHPNQLPMIAVPRAA